MTWWCHRGRLHSTTSLFSATSAPMPPLFTRVGLLFPRIVGMLCYDGWAVFRDGASLRRLFVSVTHGCRVTAGTSMRLCVRLARRKSLWLNPSSLPNSETMDFEHCAAKIWIHFGKPNSLWSILSLTWCCIWIYVIQNSLCKQKWKSCFWSVSLPSNQIYSSAQLNSVCLLLKMSLYNSCLSDIQKQSSWIIKLRKWKMFSLISYLNYLNWNYNILHWWQIHKSTIIQFIFQQTNLFLAWLWYQW